MNIQRTIPPAAASLCVKDLARGLAGLFYSKSYHVKLEHEVKEYFQVKHVFLASSGKAALTIILRALKSLSPEKREVVIPAYTCYSVPSAIVKAGLTVSLCDITSSTFDFELSLLKETLNEKTLCVIPDHLFGIPSDMDGIMSLAAKQGAFVVEDAAQAMGGMRQGKKLGTIGDVGFFSLDRGKNVTSGSGGIIITSSDRIAAAIEREYTSLEEPRAAENVLEFLKAFMLVLFIRPSLYWLPAGLPFLRLGETIFYRDFKIKKFSGIQAGLMRNWRARLEASNQARKDNAEYFCKGMGLNISDGSSTPFLRLPILAVDRDIRNSIYALSRERGIGLSRMYPASVNKIREIEDQFFGKTYPTASEVAERILTLPTHEFLSDQDKRTLVQFLNSITLSAGEEVHLNNRDAWSIPEFSSFKQ